jgi:NAD(P)H dehydrogenase (quinone)
MTAAKVLIVYDSRGPLSPLDQMADQIAEGVREEGLDAELRTCELASPADLLGARAVILGSPSHYGSVSARTKAFLDRSYEIHGQLEGRVGAAFTTSRHIGGGNETTLLALVQFLLIHGMVVQGDPKADHYGPFVITPADDAEPIVDDSGQARRLGQRVARLVKKLA